MQGEDRDRRLTRDFEKALAQHLRRDAAAAGDSACLDAGMLAAYQERQLSADEMIAAGNTSFYKVENGKRLCYDVASKTYKALPGGDAFIVMKNFEKSFASFSPQ